MTKIGIASQLFNASGAYMLDILPDADLRAGQRRISRSKTLDGGVVITDSGFAHGDRTLRINVKSSLVDWQGLWALFQDTALIYISMDDGCYSGVMESLADKGDKIAMTIFLKEKLT